MKKQEKKFKHNRKEICKLCDKEIDTSVDYWASLIDYEGKRQTQIMFYHRDCLKDLIKGKVKVIENKWKEKMSDMVVNILGKARERGLIPA